MATESKTILKRGYQSQYRQSTCSISSHKYKRLFKEINNSKDRTNSQESFRATTEFDIESRKDYNDLERKLAEKEKMKIGTRNFNKTFYTKMGKKIMRKPASFYKFGLREEQRSACKAVFSEIFQIDQWNFKGTLSVNDLWANKTLIKYLKENQMFFNKQILIKQFINMDKQQKMKKKELEKQRQIQFVNKYREWVKQNQKLNENNLSYQEVKEMDTNEACNFIRGQIERLSVGTKNKKIRTRSRKIMDVLEKSNEKYDKIAGKFKDRMVLLL